MNESQRYSGDSPEAWFDDGEEVEGKLRDPVFRTIEVNGGCDLNPGQEKTVVVRLPEDAGGRSSLVPTALAWPEDTRLELLSVTCGEILWSVGDLSAISERIALKIVDPPRSCVLQIRVKNPTTEIRVFEPMIEVLESSKEPEQELRDHGIFRRCLEWMVVQGKAARERLAARGGFSIADQEIANLIRMEGSRSPEIDFPAPGKVLRRLFSLAGDVAAIPLLAAVRGFAPPPLPERIVTIGLVPASLAPRESKLVRVPILCNFRMIQLVADPVISTFMAIHDLKVGKNSQFLNVAPLRIFGSEGRLDLYADEAGPGRDITIEVENLSQHPQTFAASLVGYINEKVRSL